MNKPNNFFLRLHQLAALAFIISAICRAEAKKQRPGFFLFGDSFLDAGNNNYINTTTLDQANFWPYGTTFFHSPTGRFSDGRLLPDFIAKYAKLPLIPPFLRPGNKVNDLVAGVNFASGGAGALVDTFRGDEIYEMGGRKFVFMNVPTLGCLPAMRLLMNRGSSCSDDRVSELAKLHNAALSMVLPQMGREMKGFKYSLFDFSRSLHRRMTRPSNYGLKEGEEACCGTGKWRGVYSCGGKRTVKEFEVCKRPYEYVFWDSFHLTEKVYHQMAAEIWNPPFSSSTTTNSPLTIGPYTLHQLFHD
ncbi:GDSL esterase/lipase 5 [Linum perenne]